MGIFALHTGHTGGKSFPLPESEITFPKIESNERQLIIYVLLMQKLNSSFLKLSFGTKKEVLVTVCAANKQRNMLPILLFTLLFSD